MTVPTKKTGERTERAAKRSLKRTAGELYNENFNHSSDAAGNPVPVMECSKETEQEHQVTDIITDKSNMWEGKHIGILNSCNDCVKDHGKLINHIKKLDEEVKHWRQQYFNLKEKLTRQTVDDEVNNKVETILKPFFSQTQIHAIVNKRKTVKQWSGEDISSAMTLRSLSPKCYRYLRDVKGFPLPSVSTLNDRARIFPCEPGLLQSVLSLMKSKSETVDSKEKLSYFF